MIQNYFLQVIFMYLKIESVVITVLIKFLLYDIFKDIKIKKYSQSP